MKRETAADLATGFKHVDKARLLWKELNASEKHGIRFGLFPYKQITAAEKEGFDGHQLCLALMDCAKDDGGMIA